MTRQAPAQYVEHHSNEPIYTADRNLIVQPWIGDQRTSNPLNSIWRRTSNNLPGSTNRETAVIMPTGDADSERNLRRRRNGNDGGRRFFVTSSSAKHVVDFSSRRHGQSRGDNRYRRRTHENSPRRGDPRSGDRRSRLNDSGIEPAVYTPGKPGGEEQCNGALLRIEPDGVGRTGALEGSAAGV